MLLNKEEYLWRAKVKADAKEKGKGKVDNKCGNIIIQFNLMNYTMENLNILGKSQTEREGIVITIK